MKILSRALCASLLVGVAGMANAQDAAVLEGDTRLACEAIMCLASANPPHECRPSIRRLFDIRRHRDRVRFLQGCPQTEGDANMESLAQLTAAAWPTCTSDWLNRNHVYYQGDNGPFVHDRLPVACARHSAHPYTEARAMPRYVGEPEAGGRWVDR